MCWRFALALALLAGCSDAGEAAPAAAAPFGGCARASSAIDGADCRIQWNCSEGGSHVLLCTELDDGNIACRCDVGEERGELLMTNAGCGEAPYEARASELCGWSLE
jgi:hypothetical protein